MLLTPNIVTIVATVILVVTAIKSARTLQRTLKWQGILMVILSALVYTVSVFPIIVYSIAEPYIEKDPLNPSPFHTHFYGVATIILTLNLTGNFFTYLLTIYEFRAFVTWKIKRWAPCFEAKGKRKM